MAVSATQGPLSGLPRRLVQDGVISEADLLTALDAIGEAVFADDLQSAGIDSVEGNVRCAERYLGRLGRSIPH